MGRDVHHTLVVFLLDSRPSLCLGRAGSLPVRIHEELPPSNTKTDDDLISVHSKVPTTVATCGGGDFVFYKAPPNPKPTVRRRVAENKAKKPVGFLCGEVWVGWSESYSDDAVNFLVFLHFGKLEQALNFPNCPERIIKWPVLHLSQISSVSTGFSAPAGGVFFSIYLQLG